MNYAKYSERARHLPQIDRSYSLVVDGLYFSPLLYRSNTLELL